MSRFPVKRALLLSMCVFYGTLSMRCATSKEIPKQSEPVASAPVAKQVQYDPDFPAELKDADSFDPASALDPALVKGSDFHSVREASAARRAEYEKGWAEQEQLENSVRESKQAAEKRKLAQQKREDEEREMQRQDELKNAEKNRKMRNHHMSDAQRAVKKLPTITEKEVQWNGLED